MIADKDSYRSLRLLQNLGRRNENVRQGLILLGRAASDPRLQGFDHEAIAEHSKQVQRQLLARVSPDTLTRPVSLGSIKDLAAFLSQDPGGLIIMRHGIQEMDDERRNLPPTAQKIANMQLPHNMTDPADVRSLAEAASFGIALKRISTQNDLPVEVISSPNLRAAEVAAVMSIGNSFNFELDNRLRCINYPDIPPTILERVLGKENSGALVWNEQVMDIVGGEGAYRATIAVMKALIRQYRTKPAITILVTHTPQTSAASAIIGEDTSRMPELGFRAINTSGSLKFPDNIFD